jgi:hypothetical protein
MSEQALFNRIAFVAAALVVLAGIFAMAAGGQSHAPPTAPVSSGTSYLYLTVAFNPVSGMDEFFPANFSVSAHQAVVLTITNYDNGSNAIPAQYQQVRGVIGGYETLWSSPTSTPVKVTAVNNPNIAHTFTIGQGPDALNVPIPVAGPTGAPSMVQVVLELNATGVMMWNCMAPCDDGSMATLGLMAGTVTVV